MSSTDADADGGERSHGRKRQGWAEDERADVASHRIQVTLDVLPNPSKLET